MISKWLWDWIGWIVLVLAVLFGQLGCTIRLKDKGSVKFTFGTTIGIESQWSGTGQESKATLESQAFEDWLKSKPETPDAATVALMEDVWNRTDILEEDKARLIGEAWTSWLRRNPPEGSEDSGVDANE